MRYASPIAALLYLCLYAIASHAADPVDYQYDIVGERSHSTQAFTQGLLLHDGTFYESSGLYGKSMLVSYPRTEPERSSWLSTRFSQRKALPSAYFAEGLTLFKDKLYLLTWRENTVFVYDPKDFSVLNRMRYEGEGWGLTDNGKELIRSDGSHRLYFHADDDFRVLRHIEVREGTKPVANLNELEYIKGYVWANIWKENRLVQIDPTSGQVIGYLDLAPLVAQVNVHSSESVLNGIAYDSDAQAMWVTGKNWPTLFLLRLKNTNATRP